MANMITSAPDELRPFLKRDVPVFVEWVVLVSLDDSYGVHAMAACWHYPRHS